MIQIRLLLIFVVSVGQLLLMTRFIIREFVRFVILTRLSRLRFRMRLSC